MIISPLISLIMCNSSSRSLTCAAFKDILDVTKPNTRLGYVLSSAAGGVVVVDGSLGGVVPHVDGVLGNGLVRVGVITVHHGSTKSVAQHLQLVETSSHID